MRLVGGLCERGWADVSEPWQEDWGWQTSTARDGHKYLISVGLMEKDDPEWLVHVQEHTGFLTRLRGKAGPSALRDLVIAVHDVLTAGPEVDQVRWHFEDLFMRGTIVGDGDPLTPRTTAEATGS